MAKTVKDLNLSPELAEHAAFLLNYRNRNASKRPQAIHWGGESLANLHEFPVEELRACLAFDDELTAKDPQRLKKTEWGERLQNELRRILEEEGKVPTKPQVVWIGPAPEKCDTCSTDITNKFVDGAAIIRGQRIAAFMCPTCFTLGPGVGQYGPALGQQYEKQPDGRWVKTRG